MKKQDSILNEAVKKLPTYTPKDSLWLKIEQNLSDPHLTKAIENLEEYVPEEKVWANINEQLNNKDQLRKLPTYTPSSNLWLEIESRLPKSNLAVHFSWLKKFVKAAAILVFIAGTYLILSHEKENQLSYSEEWVNSNDKTEWIAEDQELEMIVSSFEIQSPGIAQSDEYLELKNEFIFLTEAKASLIENYSPFEENSQLELTLTKIELERSNIIKDMATITGI